jgi:regulator of replication initiation timing
MPPKRTRDNHSAVESHEPPAQAPDEGSLPTLLHTVYHDLRAAQSQLLAEQQRNQALQTHAQELSQLANQLQAEIASKVAENARLQIEAGRLQRQPQTPPPLPRPALDSDDRNVYVFKLEKAAKSSGGDKFVCDSLPEFNIYFPQAISRRNAAAPCPVLQLRVERPVQPAPSPSSLKGEHRMPSASGIKNEAVKHELLSDDDEPIVLGFNPGRRANQ